MRHPAPLVLDPHPTRAALIGAALRQFGTAGYEGASTRAIAAAAGTNISSIAYHFGGKEGLRLACAAAVEAGIDRVARVLAPDPGTIDRAAARRLLRRLMHRIAVFLTASAGAEPMVGFLLRELGEPDSPTLGRLFAGVVAPRHRALCRLWQAATGQPADSEAVRLLVFSLVGQAAYFRIAAPMVQRGMGWDGYGPAATRAIARRLVANLDALLEAADAR